MSINLCRVCLATGATLPIFDKEESVLNIQANLAICLKEKVEDRDGYPRFICVVCNQILYEFCKFINKYKETCKLLEKGLDTVKEENKDDFICNEATNEEVAICSVKKDKEQNNLFETKKQQEPLKKILYVKLERLELPTKNKSSVRRCLEVSNKIASSILEGEFSWNGSEWCVSSDSIKNKVVKPKQSRNNERKELKIPIVNIRKPKPPKLCDLCGEVFKSHERLTVHKKRAHNCERSQCKYCSKMFNASYDLKRHILRRHETKKNFVCAICGRGFAFNGELTTHHKNVHEKHLKLKKNFKCKFCSKTYKCYKSVVIHERSAHTGYRPAVCTVCDSRFFHEEYLKEHMRLHTGETPFKCPICKRGYAQRGNMKSHMKTHKKSELDEDTLRKLRPNYLKLLKT
nr:zinc finger protein 695-like isoform X2 [Danaus plexippus plexippus]